MELFVFVTTIRDPQEVSPVPVCKMTKQFEYLSGECQNRSSTRDTDPVVETFSAIFFRD